MNESRPGDGQIRAFNYVTVEKARFYRALMRLFTDAKARFALHLRPREILDTLVSEAQDGIESPLLEEVEAALRQLCDWGNITAHPDTAEVATVEEFYRPRYLFQMTKVGEAAEAAIVTYGREILRSGELQAAALSDICDALAELLQLAGMEPPDVTKIHRTLRGLCERFDELTSRAQSFMSSLQRATDLHDKDLEAFLAYKETLIDYLERFIRELVFATADIASKLEQLAGLGMERLLALAARRDLADAIEPTEADHAESLRGWQGKWDGFRGWFIPRPGVPSQSEVLRARARSAIPTLLNAIAGIHDRRTHRSDRATDLRVLARWFAQADTDEDAHRLWRAAFSLAPSRHLGVEPVTLDERDTHPVPADTSWRDAPPLLISPRLRRTGRYVRPGRTGALIDRSKEKAYLAQQAEEEARRIAAAQERLLKLGPTWLSEIGDLDRHEFDLLCDLLGEAVANRIRPDEEVTTVSPDGSLRITLGPNADGRTAVVSTEDGVLSGLDHRITISRGHATVEQDLDESSHRRSLPLASDGGRVTVHEVEETTTAPVTEVLE